MVAHTPGTADADSPREAARYSLGPLSRAYEVVLRHALRHRGRVVALGAFLVVISIGLILAGAVGNEFFPETDFGLILMHLNLPPGSTVEETAAACRVVEEALAELPPGELKTYVSNAGRSNGTVWRRSDAGPTAGPEFAQITVDLTDEFFRRTHTPPLRGIFAIRDWLRARLDGKLPGVTLRFDQTTVGPPVGRAVVIRCCGGDMDPLVAYSAQLEKMLERVPGAIDVGTSYYAGRPELKVRPRRDEAARWGVTSTGIASVVMGAFLGTEVADLAVRNENVKIRVQFGRADQTRLDHVSLLEVPAARGGSVPLLEVADIELGSGLSHIQRRDQERVINVFCDVDRAAGFEVGEVRRAVESYLEENPPPLGRVTASVHGVNDEEHKSMEDLKHAFVIALLLIFSILTIQFGSFRQPLVVLLAVPLGLVGAVLGLYITGVKFGFMATVGVVALVGIVVNDNIVLVDYCNALRRKGKNRDDALLEAGLRRLRPIVLTTVTTLCGLLPLTLNWSGGGAFWKPLGVTIIFGLGLDSLLTLLFVPTIYSLVEKPGPLSASPPPPTETIQREEEKSLSP
jgi:HAE1 family hydrophobic/amphiphilic exporter-1